jgi:hypothetical protein
MTLDLVAMTSVAFVLGVRVCRAEEKQGGQRGSND